MVGRPVPGGATIRGIHLEGPGIAPAKAGAHDPNALRLPDADELRRSADASGASIRMVTLAPELRGSEQLIAVALELGIAVAIGHTAADYDTTVAAIEAGARHATHLFNAMTPLHHRRPGAATALLLDDRVTVEVVADLEHVHPAVLALAARCAPGRLVAVSDATPAAGLGPGSYQIGQMDVTVAGDRVTLSSDPGTLAGSVLTMERAVRNLAGAAGLTLAEAVGAATTTPARAAACAANGRGTIAAARLLTSPSSRKTSRSPPRSSQDGSSSTRTGAWPHSASPTDQVTCSEAARAPDWSLAGRGPVRPPAAERARHRTRRHVRIRPPASPPGAGPDPARATPAPAESS